MTENIVLKFNSRSRMQTMVSSHDGKIVLIDRESPIQAPDANIPYLCSFKIYDTNPHSPLKGARIVDILQPMIVDNISIKKLEDAVQVTMHGGGTSKKCVIRKDDFDPRATIKKAMRDMGCHIDYGKIDKILDAVRRKI